MGALIRKFAAATAIERLDLLDEPLGSPEIAPVDVDHEPAEHLEPLPTLGSGPLPARAAVESSAGGFDRKHRLGPREVETSASVAALLAHRVLTSRRRQRARREEALDEPLEHRVGNWPAPIGPVENLLEHTGTRLARTASALELFTDPALAHAAA